MCNDKTIKTLSSKDCHSCESRNPAGYNILDPRFRGDDKQKKISGDGVIKILKEKLDSSALDAYEIYASGERRLSIEARDGRVDSFVKSIESGVAIRTIKKGSVGFSSTTNLTEESLIELVKSAIFASENTPPSNEAVIFEPFKFVKLNYEKLSEGENFFDDIPESHKIEIAISLERDVKKEDPRIVAVRQPLYEESVKKICISNSFGLDMEATRGVVECRVRAVAEENGSSESGWESSFASSVDGLDYKLVAKKAAKRSLMLLGGLPLQTGKYDVIFDSRAASLLLSLLAPSFYADNIQKKKSVLAGKLGKKTYSDKISIIDDGLMSGGYFTFPFDGEGVPRRKMTVVKDGLLNEFLFDLKSARQENKVAGGNSYRKSIHHPPSINVSNFFLDKGSTTKEEMLSGLNKGFLITDVMGLHMANVITGDFSLGAEGHIISCGNIGRAVKGVVVVGNLHEIFKKVTAVGCDLEFLANYGSPSLFVPDIQIGGTLK